jgi:Tol biopolymer transport system component
MIARPWLIAALLAGLAGAAWGAESSSLRAKWEMPTACDPFAPPRVKDLKEELRQTGYRLAIAIHPDKPPNAKGEYLARDLYIVNADGSGLKQLTNTPDQEERTPRTSPDGRWFTYNYGDFLVDTRTLKARPHNGGYVWAPDSRRTVACEKRGIIYTDIETGKSGEPVAVKRRVEIVDLSADGRWFIFEIRNYLGAQYTIDFMPAEGGDIRKLPNHPIKAGECHPAFSPDGKWTCWNAGDSLAVRRFDPSLPDGTDGKIVTLPKEKIGQDPCGRWSHCGRYIAYVKIPAAGSWKVHSPICIVRVADGETITISPPGWVGHHWDYDWLPPADE